LAGLLADAPRRAALGLAGKNAVFTSFTDDAMAHNMLDVFAAAAHSLSPVRSGEG
jgi:hypothetical protein